MDGCPICWGSNTTHSQLHSQNVINIKTNPGFHVLAIFLFNCIHFLHLYLASWYYQSLFLYRLDYSLLAFTPWTLSHSTIFIMVSCTRELNGDRFAYDTPPTRFLFRPNSLSSSTNNYSVMIALLSNVCIWPYKMSRRLYWLVTGTLRSIILY